MQDAGNIEDADQLRRIVRYAVDHLGISFRTELAGSPYLQGIENDARWVRKLRSDDLVRRVRHIYVRRPQGGVWADKNDIEAFLRGATDPDLETISIAHELGHALVDDERGEDADRVADQIEDVERRARSGEAITHREADLYFGDEVAAWRRGARIQARIKVNPLRCSQLVDEYAGLIWDERSLKREEHPNCQRPRRRDALRAEALLLPVRGHRSSPEGRLGVARATRGGDVAGGNRAIPRAAGSGS